jgi:hypothetical protein
MSKNMNATLRSNGWMVALAVGALLGGAADLALVSTAQAQRAKEDSGSKDKEAKHTVSKNAAKPLKAAQEAMQAKKYPEAIQHLKDAENVSGKTPWDEHLINEMYGYVYGHTNDYANAAKAFEALVNDQYTEPSEIPTDLKVLTQLNYQLKNYDKAIDFGQRSIKAGVADENTETIVSQSYYLKNDYKGTIKFVSGLVDDDIKKGHEPKEQTLNLILSSCLKLEDSDCTSKALERMVTYYPKPEYWGNLVITLFQAPSQNDKSLLNTYRLANEVDVMKRPDDYTEMAQLAIEQGSPGEAQHVLEKAFQRNVFTDPRSQDKNKRLLASAQKAAQQDQATLPKISADADAAPTGDKDVGVGLAYLGYQQYDKASDFISKGITKGSLKNEPEAHLLLGIAQLKSGKKEEAVKSFKSVKGDPNLERIANLWTLHAKQA